MRFDINAHINTLNDVEEYFRFLLNDLSVNFHPDTEFEEYIQCSTGSPSFSEEECHLYNSLMQECFETCEKESGKEDIYEIGTRIFHEAGYW
ncbi:MAG: hypothetical protein LUD17_09125 [Bacteroidales bacterium]|nr:hypothetical protein [Bacteroidales bacterium]